MEKKNNTLLIFITAIFLFSIKWIYSFINFPNEDILFKIISEAISDSYFHYVKVLSDLNFNNDYFKVSNAYSLVVPIGSTIFHSIGYKLIGIFSFIFFEFIFIYLFILIFSSIFLKFDFKNNVHIFLSIIIFSIPLVSLINNDIGQLNNFISTFFNLRFPRPLVTNIYLFFFLYFLIHNYNKVIFSKKNIYILSLFFAFLISSSFFMVVPLFICLIIYFIKKKEYINLLFKIKNLKIHLIFSFIIFTVLASSFIYLVDNASPDYLSRMGVIKLEFEDKIFLLKYYFESIIKENFILLIFIPILIYFLIKKYFLNNYTYIVDLFFINYISSLLSPFILCLILSKIAFINHINNLIIINLFLLFFISIVFFLKILSVKFKKDLFSQKVINLFIILIIILNFFKPVNSIHLDEKIKKTRIDKNELILQVKEIDKSCSILTFDNPIMTFLILSDFENIPYLNGTFSNRSDEILEKNLINSLKLLKIDIAEFKKFMTSSWDGWRLKNSNMQQLFWQKYQANSFYTYKNSKDFNKNILEIIEKTSPSNIHQIAIPKFEINRLIIKYNNYSETEEHNFIIIDKNNKFWQGDNISIIHYEVFFNNENFRIYKKKDLENCLN